MPLYDYRCRACSLVTEVRHGFREPFTGACPACGGEMARVFNPAGILFKGPGFYLTDSRKAPADAAPSPAPSSESSSTAPATSSGEGGAKQSDSKKSDSSSAA